MPPAAVREAVAALVVVAVGGGLRALLRLLPPVMNAGSARHRAALRRLLRGCG